MYNPKRKKTEYEKLRDKWYAKLKKEGFNDCELDEDRLKVYSSDTFGYRKALVQNGGWQAKATYYSMAERFLGEYPFATNLEKVIWEYHSNAISVRDIVKLLRKARIKNITKTSKVTKTSVGYVVKILRTSMLSMYLISDKVYHE